MSQDYREFYADRGWRLIDLYSVQECQAGRCSAGENCRSPGKHPRFRNWMERAPRPKEVDLERSNLGLQTGRTSGLVVLDVDGTAGAASLQDLIEANGPLPPGPWAKTGSGGQHFYFEAPDGPVKTISGILPGLDVRGDGGLVVAAPSNHASGSKYELHNGAAPLPAAPDWLLSLLRGGRARFDVASYLKNAPVAVSGQGGHGVTIRVAAKLVRAGGIRSPQRFLQAIADWNRRCEPPWSEAELLHKFEDALERYLSEGRVTLPVDRNGRTINNQKTTHEIVHNDPITAGRVRLNEMGQVLEYDGERLDEPALLVLRSTIRDRYGLDTLGKDMLLEALVELGAKNTYSPVVDYLEGLRWDGQRRLDSVAEEVLGVEGPLAAAQVRKWMISAAARAFRPGVKVDHVLILQGPQGLGKSLFFDTLGRPWYSDTPIDVTSKDAWQALQKVWIYEWGELATSWTRREVNAVKGFVSSRSDVFRPPFERLTKEFPRRCVFGGSTNDTDFLFDTTGSRRWWVIECVGTKDNGIRTAEGARVLELDLAWLEANRDQLWAEATAAFRAGEHWTLPRELEADREAANQRFAPEDETYEKARSWIQSQRERSDYTGDIAYSFMAECLGVDTAKDMHTRRSLAKALTDEGFRKCQVRAEGKRKWLYRE